MRFNIIYMILLLCCINIPCSMAENNYPIIPYPSILEADKGSFELNKKTQIYFGEGLGNDYREAISLLTERLNRVANISLIETKVEKQDNLIHCRLNTSLGKEEYILNVRTSEIEIEMASATGLFYAMQTIRQLLPPEIESVKRQTDVEWKIPSCRIEDSPAFVYRGFHLDVSRHFSSLDEVKKHIDQMALLKLNKFHWHLTDDQGWRIEIKKYPRLTKVGSSRSRTLIGHHNDRPERWKVQEESGFYTQEEIRELVEYARRRHIEVIPEIEMPGHASAALASYPQYSCSGGPFEVVGKWGVFNDVYCTKDETFVFLKDVLDEVIELFPSQYIHIGGDESPKMRWERCHICQQKIKEEELNNERELQSYFIKRINNYVESKGRKIIGWDEILEGGLAPGATVMSWQGIAGGVSAAKQGHDVIMTPAYYMYLDFYQSRFANEPLANGGYNTLETVYHFQAKPNGLTADEMKHILGVQANVWTEYMPTEKHREYMIYPRIAALAEVAWVDQEKKDYRRFSNNLIFLLQRYDYMKLNYARAFFGLSHVLHPDKEEGLLLELYANNVTGGDIHYSLDGSQPTIDSPILKEKIAISREEKIVKAVLVKDRKIISDIFSQKFIVNKAGGQEVSFIYPDGTRITQNGGDNINDCIRGVFPLGRFDWYSYAGGDPSIELVFDQLTEINSIALNAAYQPQVYVYPPQEIVYEISEDGKKWKEIGRVKIEDAIHKTVESLNQIQFDKTKVKKIRLKLKLYTNVPKHKEAAGRPAPGLFFDELIVH